MFAGGPGIKPFTGTSVLADGVNISGNDLLRRTRVQVTDGQFQPEPDGRTEAEKVHLAPKRSVDPLTCNFPIYQRPGEPAQLLRRFVETLCAKAR